MQTPGWPGVFFGSRRVEEKKPAGEYEGSTIAAVPLLCRFITFVERKDVSLLYKMNRAPTAGGKKP